MANIHQNFAPHQDFDSYGSQLAVFRVQINCCRDCPEKLKTKLQILKGIESVEVNERRNVVTLKGTFDSKEIIKKLESWGKKSELVHERKETNPNGYRVELVEDDEEEIDLSNDSFRHKDSSFRHKDSSSRHRNSPNRHNDPSNRARDSGSSRAQEKYDNSESNAYSRKEFPDHICRDKYCAHHKRENTKPNTNNNNANNSANNSASYPPMFHGGHYYSYPYVPPTYGPVPPPPPPWPLPTPPTPPNYGQYYGPGMMPPAGYGHFGYRNSCNIM